MGAAPERRQLRLVSGPGTVHPAFGPSTKNRKNQHALADIRPLQLHYRYGSTHSQESKTLAGRGRSIVTRTRKEGPAHIDGYPTDQWLRPD